VHLSSAINARLQTDADFFDLCSGVESEKGVKSIEMIKQLQQID